MGLFNLRALLSSLLLSLAVLALLTSTIAEAKKCKAHKQKNSRAHLGISADVKVSVGSGVQRHGGNGKKFFKNGKAGLSGGQSMEWMKDCVSWFADWTPDPLERNEAARKDGSIEGLSMLWGLKRVQHDSDPERFDQFMRMDKGKYKMIAYLNEFDFEGDGSSGKISVEDAVDGWNRYIVPYRHANPEGVLLIGPSCAMQDHEDACTAFVQKVKDKPDAVSVHIFKNTIEGVRKSLDHYRKLGYPMIITELACINYEGGAHEFCSQEQTNAWWPEVIKIMEEDDDVMAYSPSDANNGPHAALHSGNGLSETGKLIKQLMCKYSKKGQ